MSLQLSSSDVKYLKDCLKVDIHFKHIYDTNLKDKMTYDEYIDILFNEVDFNSKLYILEKDFLDVSWIALSNGITLDMDELFQYAKGIED